MKETARLYFAGDDVTVNLIPATIILLLLTLGEFEFIRTLCSAVFSGLMSGIVIKLLPSVSNDQIYTAN